jgi:hypothetical protein
MAGVRALGANLFLFDGPEVRDVGARFDTRMTPEGNGIRESSPKYRSSPIAPVSSKKDDLPLAGILGDHVPTRWAGDPTGVSRPGTKAPVDIGPANRRSALRDEVVSGNVNANRRHHASAAEALQNGDESWLKRLVTRRVSIDEYTTLFACQDDDIKVVLELGGRSR